VINNTEFSNFSQTKEIRLTFNSGYVAIIKGSDPSKSMHLFGAAAMTWEKQKKIVARQICIILPPTLRSSVGRANDS